MIVDLRPAHQHALRPGDKLSRPMLGVPGLDHFGVYVGPIGPGGEDTIHNDKDSGQVVLTHFDYFAQGQRVKMVARWARTADEQQAIVNRAVALLGLLYNLADFNCEHTADIAVFGSPVVEQTSFVKSLVGLALIGGVIALVPSRH